LRSSDLNQAAGDSETVPRKRTVSEPGSNSKPGGSTSKASARLTAFPPSFKRPCYAVLDEPVHMGLITFRDGVYKCDVVPSEEGEQLTETWFCSPLHLKAVTFDEQGNNFGRLLRFKPTAGEWREWAMPMELLASDGAQLRSELLSMGLELDPFVGRKELQAYLHLERPQKQVLCALQTGWCDKTFVLPDVAIGPRSREITFQSNSHNHDEYTKLGTLEGWRKGIAEKAIGNPALMIAIAASFAGPLLELCNGEGGGVHFVGSSSSGKSSVVAAACATWGGSNYLRSWKTTANGMEGAAAMFNDSLFALDEISECDPQHVGAIVYALTNGRGKQRASRSGVARSITRWRCIVLSTGEKSVTTSMEAGGYKAKAGQTVRLLDLPMKGTFGVWDDLHGAKSGQALSDALRKEALLNHTHAGRAFLENLTVEKSDLLAMFEEVKKSALFATEGIEGQEKRAAARMALIGMAGELATEYGLTGWPTGASGQAASVGLRVWLDNRGRGSDERRQILRQVRDFIERHGDARFSDAHALDEFTVRDRAGWWRETAGSRDYLFTASGMKEALKGFDLKPALDVLQAAHALPVPGANGERASCLRINGRPLKLYVINPEFLDERDHGA